MDARSDPTSHRPSSIDSNSRKFVPKTNKEMLFCSGVTTRKTRSFSIARYLIDDSHSWVVLTKQQLCLNSGCRRRAAIWTTTLIRINYTVFIIRPKLHLRESAEQTLGDFPSPDCLIVTVFAWITHLYRLTSHISAKQRSYRRMVCKNISLCFTFSQLFVREKGYWHLWLGNVLAESGKHFRKSFVYTSQ